MKMAYILHGICDEEEYLRMAFPSPSNAHWLPWLQQKFLRSGVLCQTPEMPVPYAPRYEDWREVWERMAVDKDTVVVGHSAGCGFVLKWLAANPKVRLAKLVLVAPWRDPAGIMRGFVQGELDAALVKRVGEMHILVSSDDMADVLATVEELEKVYPEARMHRFEGKGHFCEEDIGVTFEALARICGCS